MASGALFKVSAVWLRVLLVNRFFRPVIVSDLVHKIIDLYFYFLICYFIY